MKNNGLSRLACSALLGVVVAAGAGCRSVNSTPPASAGIKEAAPATHTVTRTPGKPKAQIEAVFEAVEMTPLKIEPKAWLDFTVLEAVPHGARVRKGDTLVKLDLEKLKEQINDLEQDQPAAAVALEVAAAELANLEQTTPYKLEAARRSQRIASEDLDYFEKIGRAQKEKGTVYNIKYAEQRLEGAREELKQLEKMYKADDVTEETEEIILKRQKYAVDSAEYGLETAKQSASWTMKTGIPRDYDAYKTQKRDQDLALVLGEQTIPKGLTKKHFEVEKLKRDQKKADKRLADLKKDLENLMIRSPMDGVVYYGACEAGKWTTGAVVAKKLAPNGKLTPNEVFITVVNPEKLLLKGIVQESELEHFKTGMQGKASLVSAPDKKLAVKLEEIGGIPLPTGGFEARLSVEKSAAPRVVPGMNCKVSLFDSEKADRIMVPKEAVFGEGDAAHVFAWKSGQSEKRAVQTGETDGKMIEILGGLSEGENILLQKPM